MRPTHAIIDLAALRHNCRQICKELAQNVTLSAVFKADGYGHGAVKIAKAALSAGAQSLAVAIPEEGILLRKSGINVPILILGVILPEQAVDIVAYSLIPAVCSLESLKSLSAAAAKLSTTAKVMLKLDTGMGRVGIQPEELLEFCRQTAKYDRIIMNGVFTHLATADAKDKSYANNQLIKFHNSVTKAIDHGFKFPYIYISAANSAAIIDLPDSHHTTVRAGIALYGLPASNEMHRSLYCN